MKQHEAVYNAMVNQGGYSTLGDLYRTAIKMPNCIWKAKDPYANIRRVVQTNPLFFRIKPGLWGLSSKKDEILKELGLSDDSPKQKEERFTHSYYQGLLLQIGKIKGFDTYIPQQDKNKPFIRKRLGDFSSIVEIFPFTYDYLLNKAKSIDVIWFNDRRLPDSFFEVEHSTNIQNALMKFVNFQDFRIKFYIVADRLRKLDYENKASQYLFKPIFNYIRFLDYDSLSKIYTKESELAMLKEESGF